MPNSRATVTRLVLFSLLLVLQMGCAAKSLINWNRSAVPEADERNPVRKIICVWEPVQGQGLDGLPSRGFAGQIMFFTNGSPSPATSAGDVRVYLFHNRGTPEEQAKPIHQFDFKGEAWSQHLTESVPGPSYRIFIPYVDKQPWQVNCGLRVRLTPPNGSPVFSELVYVRLPGPVEGAPNQAVISQPRIRPDQPQTGDDSSEIQIGAVLERHRGIAPGAAQPTQVSKQESALERARKILAEEVQNEVSRPRRSRPVPSMLAVKSLAVKSDEAPHASVAGDETFSEVEKADLPSKRLLSRQTVRGNAPSEPATARRFRMTPAKSTKSHPLIDTEQRKNDRQVKAQSHPLDDSPQKPHPLTDQ